VLCLGLLAGCSHLREQSADAPAGWTEQRAKHSALDSWYVQGRLGVQTAHQGGSLDVYWNQQGEHYQIRLLAPMGQGAFLITGDASAVRLQRASGETQTANNADQLFADSLGVSLPLKSLQHWLRGLPASAAAQLQWDVLGNLYIIKEDGWRVEMARYHRQQALNLPHQFYLSRADQPELMIKLVLSSWQLTDLPALAP
jgi:outer membrane lipoprotein LolB